MALKSSNFFYCCFNYILGAKCLLKGAQAVSLILVFDNTFDNSFRDFPDNQSEA